MRKRRKTAHCQKTKSSIETDSPKWPTYRLYHRGNSNKLGLLWQNFFGKSECHYTNIWEVSADSIRNKTNGYSEDKKRYIRGENAFDGLISGVDLA